MEQRALRMPSPLFRISVGQQCGGGAWPWLWAAHLREAPKDGGLQEKVLPTVPYE